MKTRFLLIPLLLTVLAAPVFALAQTIRPGTEDYLRKVVKLEKEAFETSITTENREPFLFETGETAIDDPLGDVLNRFGMTNSVQVPWGDIESAELAKNPEADRWEVTVKLGGFLPANPHPKVQLFFYVDTDGDETNNDLDGIRGQADAEFSIQHNKEENSWYTDYKWFNAEADFWAFNEETEATYEVEGNAMRLLIPFDEIPEDLEPNWRVVMAVQDGRETQVDAAPGIGFPPPIGGEYPKEPFRLQIPDLQVWHIVLGLSLLSVIIYVIWILKSGRSIED